MSDNFKFSHDWISFFQFILLIISKKKKKGLQQANLFIHFDYFLIEEFDFNLGFIKSPSDIRLHQTF